jgi:GAF domain-containing protein
MAAYSDAALSVFASWATWTVASGGLAPTLQQVTDGAKQLFRADGAGLMLVDAEGQLRWASASDQAAQTVEDEQERLAQGPCAVAFSQRLPAAIRDLRTEPDWQEFTQVLVSEGICAALSVPVELDGGVIGTLDSYARQARDWDPSEVAALQAYAGLVASLLMAAVAAQVKGRLADQLQAALAHRWLIEQAKGVIMGREELDAKPPLSGCGGRPGPRPGGWPMWPGT